MTTKDKIKECAPSDEQLIDILHHINIYSSMKKSLVDLFHKASITTIGIMIFTFGILIWIFGATLSNYDMVALMVGALITFMYILIQFLIFILNDDMVYKCKEKVYTDIRAYYFIANCIDYATDALNPIFMLTLTAMNIIISIIASFN